MVKRPWDQIHCPTLNLAKFQIFWKRFESELSDQRVPLIVQQHGWSLLQVIGFPLQDRLTNDCPIQRHEITSNLVLIVFPENYS
jgi:hypothetical protein